MWVCVPAPICQLSSYTTVLFKVLYCKVKNIYFCVCFLCTYYLCEKYYKCITVQYYIQIYIHNCVSWVPRLTVALTNKLDLLTCSQNGTRLSVGNLLKLFTRLTQWLLLFRIPPLWVVSAVVRCYQAEAYSGSVHTQKPLVLAHTEMATGDRLRDGIIKRKHK